MRMFRSKKAQTEEAEAGEMPLWTGLIVTFALIAMVIALFVLLGKYRGLSLETPEDLYVNTYINRLISSPSCLAYEDPLTGRTYPGLVDMSKFTNENIRKCLAVVDSSPIGGFTLAIGENEIETEDFGVLRRNVAVPVFVKTAEGSVPEKLLVGVRT